MFDIIYTSRRKFIAIRAYTRPGDLPEDQRTDAQDRTSCSARNCLFTEEESELLGFVGGPSHGEFFSLLFHFRELCVAYGMLFDQYTGAFASLYSHTVMNPHCGNSDFENTCDATSNDKAIKRVLNERVALAALTLDHHIFIIYVGI